MPVFRFEIHHYHHSDAETMAVLRRIDERTATMEDYVTRIEQKVGELTTVALSSEALLDEVAQLVRDNINNPERLAAILDGIEANRARIAASVARNTDVDPTPDPPLSE